MTHLTAEPVRTHRPDVVALARREQALLTAALTSLFTNPDLDTRISQALDYPRWPQPITLLPAIAPDLTTATPQLAAYLAFAASASAETITAVTEDGWPTRAQRGAADAAWLLLQHADLHNEQRRALLPVVADAVRCGDADPRHLALLTDRVHAVCGEPQRYGTLRLIRDEQPELLYPLAGPDTDRDREAIGLPNLADDARYAYAPLIPYGVARTCPTNPAQPFELAALRPEANLGIPPDQPAPLPAGRIGVYLAATLRYRNQLRRHREAMPASLLSTSRWLDIDPLTRASCQLDAGPALNQLAARVCLADIARSHVLIAFAEHRRSDGLSVEIGAGLALGKHVILIGPPRCSFDMLPDVTVVASLDEALTAADDPAAQRTRAPA